jgi:hypothetical protein
MPVFNIRRDGPPVTSGPTTTTTPTARREPLVPVPDIMSGEKVAISDILKAEAKAALMSGMSPTDAADWVGSFDYGGWFYSGDDVNSAVAAAQNEISGTTIGVAVRPDDPSASTIPPMTTPGSAPLAPYSGPPGGMAGVRGRATSTPASTGPSLPVPIGSGGPPGGMAGIKERFPAPSHAPSHAPPTLDETRLGRLSAEDAALARYIELLGASLGAAPDITGQLDARSLAAAKQTDDLNTAIRNLGLDVPQSSATPLDATLLGGAPSNQQFTNRTGAGRTDLSIPDGPSMEALLAARVGGYSPELAVKAVLDSIGVRDAVAATESADKTLTDLSDELTSIREKKAELEVRIAEDRYATDTKEREKRADELAKKKLEDEEAKTKLNVAIRASKSVFASSPEASELFSNLVAEGIKRIAVDESTTPFAWRTEAQDFEEWDKLVAMLPPSVDAETASKLLEVLVRDGSGYAG